MIVTGVYLKESSFLEFDEDENDVMNCLGSAEGEQSMDDDKLSDSESSE